MHGENCRYAHGEQELRQAPAKSDDVRATPVVDALFKTALCFSFEKNGRCSSGGECRYAHGNSELRVVPSAKKVLETGAVVTVQGKSYVCEGFGQQGFVYRSLEGRAGEAGGAPPRTEGEGERDHGVEAPPNTTTARDTATAERLLGAAPSYGEAVTLAYDDGGGNINDDGGDNINADDGVENNLSCPLADDPNICRPAPTTATTDPRNDPLYKTKLCSVLLTKGRCKRGAECRFAHGQAEPRVMPELGLPVGEPELR